MSLASLNFVPQRKTQWIYLLPIAGAPIAHVLVSSTHLFSKRPHLKRWVWIGVGISTVSMVLNRLWLMNHAGYPGGEEKDLNDPRYFKGSEKSLK